MAKLPAFQFYPGDWMKDPALRSVSVAARGLWIDMLCLMHESSYRGYLQHANGNGVTAEQIARMTGCSTDECVKLLNELDHSGVYSRTEEGVIYSRRVVRDEQKRTVCIEAGKRGGNPTLKGGVNGRVKGGVKGVSKGHANPNPTPSSSSSSSTAVSEELLSPRGGDVAGFDEFWSAWPRHHRKVGKPKCLAHWKKHNLESIADRVLAALKRSVASPDWTKDNGEFIPMPMSWLNKSPWETDDDDATAGPAAGDLAQCGAVTLDELRRRLGVQS